MRSSEDDLIPDKEKAEIIENVDNSVVGNCYFLVEISQSPKLRKHSLGNFDSHPADQLANNVEVIDLTDSPHPVKVLFVIFISDIFFSAEKSITEREILIKKYYLKIFR